MYATQTRRSQPEPFTVRPGIAGRLGLPYMDAPLALAALLTVAYTVVFGTPFNFANVIVIPLLIGLGVASSIHIVGRAREEAHEGGDASVLSTSTPLAVLITQLNTVAAFATLAVAHHRGLFSMGVLLGISIFFVLIVSLIVLPSFMIAIGIGAPKPAKDAPAANGAPSIWAAATPGTME